MKLYPMIIASLLFSLSTHAYNDSDQNNDFDNFVNMSIQTDGSFTTPYPINAEIDLTINHTVLDPFHIPTVIVNEPNLYIPVYLPSDQLLAAKTKKIVLKITMINNEPVFDCSLTLHAQDLGSAQEHPLVIHEATHSGHREFSCDVL